MNFSSGFMSGLISLSGSGTRFDTCTCGHNQASNAQCKHSRTKPTNNTIKITNHDAAFPVDADAGRELHIFARELRDERTIGAQHLHAVVAAVAHDDVLLAVDGDRIGVVKAAWRCALAADRARQPACAIENLCMQRGKK